MPYVRTVKTKSGAAAVQCPCVGEVEPSLFRAFNPWDQITTPEALAGLLTRACVPHPAVEAARDRHQLEHPDGFWDIVLGSGYRATVDALSPDQQDRVRDSALTELRSRQTTVLRTDVVFATATRSERRTSDPSGG